MQHKRNTISRIIWGIPPGIMFIIHIPAIKGTDILIKGFFLISNDDIISGNAYLETL